MIHFRVFVGQILKMYSTCTLFTNLVTVLHTASVAADVTMRTKLKINLMITNTVRERERDSTLSRNQLTYIQTGVEAGMEQATS